MTPKPRLRQGIESSVLRVTSGTHGRQQPDAMLRIDQTRNQNVNWYSAILIVHVAFGTLALIAFWITASLRKGTRTHRQVGTTYLLAMLTVMLSAIPLAGAAFVGGHTLQGVFLSYLVVITATPLWVGRRAVQRRHSAQEFADRPYRALGAINVACAMVVLGLGITTGRPLLDGLSAVGLFVGIRILRFSAKGATARQWWLKQHYLSMGGSGIATHIAFLNIGLPRILPAQMIGSALYLAWFGPIVVAAVAAWWVNRRYGRGVDGMRLTAIDLQNA
jgi:hypothetical protein